MLQAWKTQNPRSIAFAVLRVPILIALPLLMALIPKLILDCMAEHASYKYFAFTVLTMSLAIVALRWLDPFLQSKLNWAAQQFRISATIKTMHKLLTMDYPILEHPKTKLKIEAARQFAFVGRFSESQQFYEITTQLAANSFGILSYIILLCAIHPLLLLVLVATGAVELLLLKRRSRIRSQFWTGVEKINAQLDDISQAVSDARTGKDVRIYQVGYWFSRLFNKFLCSLVKLNGRYIRQSLNVNALQGLSLLLREGIAFGFIFYFAWNGKISVADFVFYASIVSGFSAWLSGVSNQLGRLLAICGSCGRFREFMDLPDTRNNVQNSDMIKFCGISFAYPGSQTETLKDITLTIQPNERIALVGENGAGKTTLIKLLCGFYQPTQGNISVNIQNISAIFQDAVILPMRVKDNIAFGADIDEARLEKAMRDAGIWEKVRSLPLGIESNMVSQVYDDAAGFSGGELQRLLLARALYRDASVLLLDEPTAALDPLAERRLYQAYDKFTAGKTVVFVSHRLASTQFCDRIVFIQDGQITEQGTHEELMRFRGAYWRMFEVQRAEYRGGEAVANA